MINATELLFTVDDSNNPIEPQQRKIVHQKGIWHRVTHIWIINEKNILTQQRSLKKDSNPGLWEPFFGGHMLAGSDHIKAASDELQEELGIKVKKGELTLDFIFKNIKSHEFTYIFILDKQINLDNVVIEKEEIEKIEWKKFEEVQKKSLDLENREWSHLGYEEKVLGRLAL